MIKSRNIDKESILQDVGEWLVYGLAAGSADDFALSVQNPYDKDLLIDRAVIRTTTAGGTATSVLDVAVVDNDTATGDTLFDGVDLDAAKISDSMNSTDNGTNGVVRANLWDKRGGYS